MNNDIRPPRPTETPSIPPRRPFAPPRASGQLTPPQTSMRQQAAPQFSSAPEPQESLSGLDGLPPVGGTPAGQPPQGVSPSPKPKKSSKKKVMLGVFVGGILLLALAVAAAVFWYIQQLTPVATKDTAVTEQLKIESGATPDQIARELKQKNLIRSELGFLVYTRLNGVRGQLQAGSYLISTSESMKDIVGHLTSGKVEEYKITFYPGAALSSSAAGDKTPTHKQVLMKAGFDETEIDEAFTARYDHPLLAGKPASADLEGYIYGDTYQIAAGSSVEEVLEKTFDEFYAKLEEKDVFTALSARQSSLYDAITLASIVQKESGGDDKAQIAQVFYSRLEKGMTLGSDVTYQYAADKMGVPRDVNLNSPYNTRRFEGLPPGPIASPGIAAMEAVARPASGDFLYFLSGDDNVTYYARTEAEHQKNITDHCKEKCQIL